MQFAPHSNKYNYWRNKLVSLKHAARSVWIIQQSATGNKISNLSKETIKNVWGVYYWKQYFLILCLHHHPSRAKQRKINSYFTTLYFVFCCSLFLGFPFLQCCSGTPTCQIREPLTSRRCHILPGQLKFKSHEPRIFNYGCSATLVKYIRVWCWGRSVLAMSRMVQEPNGWWQEAILETVSYGSQAPMGAARRDCGQRSMGLLWF